MTECQNQIEIGVDRGFITGVLVNGHPVPFSLDTTGRLHFDAEVDITFRIDGEPMRKQEE